VKELSIQYLFTLPDGTVRTFDVRLDIDTLCLIRAPESSVPSWTQLDFHQCPNCTLSPQAHPHCPLATSLVDIVEVFESLVSYDEVQVDVTTAEKTTRVTTSVQQGVGSLMGLVVATSGCPHTVYFRPMARFHAPFSDEVETLYRAASMYLLAQYFIKQEGKPAGLELKGLSEIYKKVQVVNRAVAERIREASKTDATLNALVQLDMFAQVLPDAVEESLAEIRYLFAPFLSP